MKNTPNYANKIINRLEKGLPLTWEEMDGNDLYGNIWETNFEYKTSMVVLWNDYIGSNNDTGRMSFWMCRINHKSEDTKKPGTSGGNTYWDRIDTFPINTTNDNNIITLNMSDGNNIVFDLNNWINKYRADTYSDDSNTPNYSGPWGGYTVLTPNVLWTWDAVNGWVDNYPSDGIWYINGINRIFISNGDINEIYEITNFSEETSRISADANLSIGIMQRVSTDDFLSNEINFLKGAQQSLVFDDYSVLVSDLLQFSIDDIYGNIGQNYYIKTTNVPDLWVSDKSEPFVNYTYTTDQALIDAINSGGGSFKVGYFNLSFLETQKVNLTNYVTTTMLSTESSIRSSTDTILSNSISTEFVTRSTADASLTSRISAEEVTRSTGLSTEISQRISTDLTKLDFTNVERYSDSETAPQGAGGYPGEMVLTPNMLYTWNESTSTWDDTFIQNKIYYVNTGGEIFLGDVSDGYVYEITNVREATQRVSTDTILSTALSTELSQRVSSDLFINNKIDNQYGQKYIPLSGITTNIIDGGLSENTKTAMIIIEARCAGVGVNVKEIYITNFNSTLSYQTSFTPTYSVNLYNFTVDYGLSDTIYINVNTLYDDVYIYYKKDILI